MKKILITIPILVLMAAGCSSSQPAATQNTGTSYNQTPTPTEMMNPSPTAMMSPTPTGAMSPTPTKASASATIVLGLGNSSTLGTHLVASNGMTLYASSGDSSGMSNCTGQCASAWPPYTESAGLTLGAAAGITGKIGSIVRADDTTQVTYNGMPLYFWTQDKAAGDTTGQNVNGFTVVKP